MRSQPIRPLCIGNSLFSMLAAINLNDKLLLKANKIHDVGANRLLSPKLMAANLSKP